MMTVMFNRGLTGILQKDNKALKAASSGQGMIELVVMVVFFALLMVMMTGLSVFLYLENAAVTVAREGSRLASLNSNLGDASTSAQGVAEIRDEVRTLMESMTGQVLTDGQILVTPPDPAAPLFDRNVTVQVTFNMNNPVGINALMEGLGTTSSIPETLPISATATMRYEE